MGTVLLHAWVSRGSTLLVLGGRCCCMRGSVGRAHCWCWESTAAGAGMKINWSPASPVQCRAGAWRGHSARLHLQLVCRRLCPMTAMTQCLRICIAFDMLVRWSADILS